MATLGVNDLSDEELAAVLGDLDNDESSSPETQNTETSETQESTQDTSNVENTKAFAARLKERTDKAVAAEHERIAKQFGYDSFEAMEAASTKRVYEEAGLDQETIEPIVNKLVEARLANDPRMKELETYQQQAALEFEQKELKELSKLTGIQFNSLDDIPKDVVEDWRKSGSLKKSYLALHGEELITKTRKAASTGSTEHLASSGGTTTSATQSNKRHLTPEERKVYKQMIRGITDEELDKTLVEK